MELYIGRFQLPVEQAAQIHNTFAPDDHTALDVDKIRIPEMCVNLSRGTGHGVI